MRALGTLGMLACAALLAACPKVPIADIEARFALSDAAWFEDEQTLFYFFEIEAEQGISDASVVEVRYTTDDEVMPWTKLSELEPVHTHLEVDCGANKICGSFSLHVPLEPRAVGIRMRYHVDGPLALDTEPVFNAVYSGPAHTNRSFLVYGVFTEDNRRVQWRGRHRFPTLRNQRVQELGLRRRFDVDAHAYGAVTVDFASNPYGYATGCPGGLEPAALPPVGTEARAVFDEAELPVEASDAPAVCARVTVHEPAEPFVTSALARKNPEVERAFPVLRSPVKAATPIRFYLTPCMRTIEARHEQMLRQRLLFEDGAPYCIDDWDRPGFVDELVVLFRDAVDRTRFEGRDMVLVIGLNRDDPAVADRLEEALAQVVPLERDRGSPRLVGAFVFDSAIRNIRDDALSRVVLWCPAQVVDEDLQDVVVDASRISCGILADNENLVLGPFSLSTLPILPSRDRYIDFIETYSEGQAGRVTAHTYLAPEFTPTTDNQEFEGFVASFLNGEAITAAPDDAFSYCAPEALQPFVFRSQISQSPALDCPEDGRPAPDFCLPPGQDFLPIELLPEWHEALEEPRYELGLVWDFPWLLRLEYEAVGAANASAFGLSLPFGFGFDQVDELGTQVWLQSEFPLGDTLLRCNRYCDHPTFDSAGVYQVTDTFREAYRAACYRPVFPAVGDSSFPLDP